MRTWQFEETHPKGEGPWTAEPDKAQWVDEATGLDCLIVRNRLGALCGYVGVPPEHPLHGLDYDKVYDVADLEVHGGLTFADRCQEARQDRPEGFGVCHVPEPGRPADVWWLGFDCAHAGDLVPGMDEAFATIGTTRLSYYRTDVYRTFDYVRDEVTRLAAQVGAPASQS